MTEVVVPSNSMALFLIADFKMEPTPDPIRLQPEVSIRLDFSQYVDFIKCDIGYGDTDLLRTPSSVLLEATKATVLDLETTWTQGLYAAFLRDVAVAVAKEVWYSQRYGKEPSRIRHTAEGLGVPFTWRPSTVDEVYETHQDIPKAANSLKEHMSSRGYIDSYLRDCPSWRYAVVAELSCSPLFAYIWDYAY